MVDTFKCEIVEDGNKTSKSYIDKVHSFRHNQTNLVVVSISRTFNEKTFKIALKKKTTNHILIYDYGNINSPQ